ncbi:hypothetical protein NE865_14801 [Phthorimaea operculella]|nr:hypothetical protein NE865_14801 [Phthorimaea operculella]
MDSNGREGQSSDTRAMDNTSDRKRKRDENFYCEVCDISLSRKEHLERHNKSKAHKKKLETSSIGVKDSEAKKRRPNQKCKVCGIDVVNLHAHMKTNEHKDKCTEAFKDNVELINTCYKSRVASYRIRCHNKHLVPKEFMNDVKDCAMYLIAEKRDELNSSLKINFELFGEFLKVVNDDSVIEIKSFNTKNRVIEKRFDEDLDAVYEIFTEDVAVQADEFQERDSGWAMQEILYLEVNINEFSTMKSKSNQEKIVAISRLQQSVRRRATADQASTSLDHEMMKAGRDHDTPGTHTKRSSSECRETASPRRGLESREYVKDELRRNNSLRESRRPEPPTTIA